MANQHRDDELVAQQQTKFQLLKIYIEINSNFNVNNSSSEILVHC